MKRRRLTQLEVWKMAKTFMPDVKKIVYIAEKDVKIYFFKGPNLTFGLLLPVVLYLAFAIGRTVDPTNAVPGLVAIAAFFGAGAIQAISLPLERRTGTFNSLVILVYHNVGQSLSRILFRNRSVFHIHDNNDSLWPFA
jgi:hypothetical protein